MLALGFMSASPELSERIAILVFKGYISIEAETALEKPHSTPCDPVGGFARRSNTTSGRSEKQPPLQQAAPSREPGNYLALHRLQEPRDTVISITSLSKFTSP